ncbi:hypothetical protein LSCM1_00915 [Leishmania martiniquensis]|uniref:Uncharacterized protein n=1 Tax=Leishmania martiniquensis TaxID=1580590 RepID=A0A836G5I8_9TRYP|nr:hypothetical protein LSCM1_00915 [Leishmania martiniquensis]
MRSIFAKENFLDLAHQAVGAVRRIVGSPESWGVRDTLSPSSQVLMKACKTNTAVDAATLEVWVSDLVRELEPQSAPSAAAAETAGEGAEVTSSSGKDEALRPLSESALIESLELARALVYSCNGEEAAKVYSKRNLVASLVQLHGNATLSQKLRDCCANVLVAVCSSQQSLLRDFTFVFTARLRSPPQDRNGRILQILLASLLVEVFHQLQLLRYGRLKTDLDAETVAQCTSLIDCLFETAYSLMLQGEAAGSPSGTSSRTASGEAEESVGPRLPSPSPAPHEETSVAAAGVNTDDGSIGERTGSPTTTVTASVGSGDAAVGPPVSTISDVAASGWSLNLTTSVVFLAVVAGVYRARPALKTYLVRHFGAEYAHLWVKVASELSEMHTSLLLQLPSRSSVSAMLEPVEYWRGEMLEGLVELCTADSFTIQRAMVMASIAGSGSSMASSGTRAHQQGMMPLTRAGARSAALVTTSPSRGAAAAAAAALDDAGLSPIKASRYQFVPIPADWETYLSRSSSAVWRLASALFPCTVTSEGVGILKAVLLLLNTRHASAEALYRSTISTLTLLCSANPRNAVRLSEHHFLRTIMALVNCNQPSVFPASQAVTLHFRRGEPSTSDSTASPTQTLTLTPANTLNVNTTQLTFCLLNTLTSTTFSKATAEMLMQGIKDMCSMPSSQTDVDIIENFLYGLGRAFIPHPLLFFPGGGYVSWRLKHMFPRGSGYTFTAWVYPTCVWTGGSCLYSFMDPNDTRVCLLVVAEGRQCSLAVRVNKAGGEPTELVLANGTFAASTWTHVVVNHGVALNVYIDGQRLEVVHDVPYPKEKHSIMFNIGGAAQLPGFVGFVSGMNISATLSEKEIAKLHAAGPAFYDPSRDCASFLRPFFEDRSTVKSDPQTPSVSSSLQQNDMIAKRSAEFRWDRIELYVPTDVEELMAPSKVAEWVLNVLRGRRSASVQSTSTFMNVAKLSLSLLSTSMQLATREQLTQLMRKNYLERLRTEVLSWKTTFPEFASLMLQSVSPRGGGKLLHSHACTQSVFDILLSCVLRASAHGSGGASGVPHHLLSVSRELIEPSDESAAASAVSSPRSDGAQEANATNIILRELSDYLLVKENKEMFQEDSARFQRILDVSLHLPKECIKSVVILIEKLCRSEAELRRVLLFLFTPSSVSPTADTAKVWVLRMLFDVAREEVAMCEMIQECFKGRGVALMLLLVNGENHSSEAIRVLALGLLSLLMPLKSCAKLFKKSDGFDILSLTLTDPRSDIPLGIRTFDALFQVAFDEFRRHREKKPEADSIAMRLMATAHILHRQKQRDPSSAAASGSGGGPSASAAVAELLLQGRAQRRIAEYLGHTPSIMVNQLGTRRGYSFEHTHDYGRVSEDFGELVLLHKGSRYHNLQLPLALKTVLCALDYLIRVLIHRLSSTLPMFAYASALTVSATTGSNAAGSSTDQLATSNEYPALPTQNQESVLASTNARGAQMDDERVVIEVLNYLEKLIEWPKHALKVMDIPWLGGLWEAAHVFFERPADLSGMTGAVTPVQPSEQETMAAVPVVVGPDRPLSLEALQPSDAAIRRLHQDHSEFVSEVTQRCRAIIRKMVILDISMNERAQIRSIRDGEHPPRLVRIVLEEVARYFSVQKNGELLENASNVIRNLNSLFKDVHAALHPFPPTLGVAIVVAITNISVSSSMRVRRRMKNSSNLLTIRDNIAFYVLRESRRFLRLRKRSLNQLIHMNAGNANSMTVLLLHLSNSIKENNVNEVEVLVTLIRQLAGADSARLRELHALLGSSEEARILEELLGSNSGARSTVRSPLLRSGCASQPTLSDHCMSDVLMDVDLSSGGAERAAWSSSYGAGSNVMGEEAEELSSGAYTVQVLEWCKNHKEGWAAIQRNVRAAVANMGLEKNDRAQQQQISGACGSPKAAAGALVGPSDRSKRELQQLREEFQADVAKTKASTR